MVKIKNPDDQLINTNGAAEIVNDLKTITAAQNGEKSNEKRFEFNFCFKYLLSIYRVINFFRVSNAPHRSLPDIPISDPIATGGGTGDTGSDLYATVGDKSASEKLHADRNRKC